MSRYNIFARFYDALTENVDYKLRSAYISDFFKNQNIHSFLDLACGTCSMSAELADSKCRVIGIDSSSEMLAAAQKKLSELKLNFTLICAKMQDFVLTDKVDACVCCLDSINHLTNTEDVLRTFKNVYRSLNEGGKFIFDVNTIYKHNNILADNSFLFDEDDFFLAWDNELCRDNTVRILLDFFIYNGKNYDRFSEAFFERAYALDEIEKMLISAGFYEIKCYDDLTLNPPKDDSERVYFVCRK